MVTAAEWSSEHEALRTQIGNALSNPLVSESQVSERYDCSVTLLPNSLMKGAARVVEHSLRPY
jgi:hypothetical protein